MAILVSGCRKEVGFSASDVVYRIQTVIRDSMGTSAASTLDFHSIKKVRVAEDSVYYLVRSKANPNAFVALWMNRTGHLVKGVQVSLEPDVSARKDWEVFNGTLTIATLSGRQVARSVIQNGLVRHLVKTPKNTTLGIVPRSKVAPVESDDELLGEVVVIGYRSGSNDYSYSTWVSIGSMFGEGAGGWYYAPIGGGSSTPPAHGGIYEEDPIRIDEEKGIKDPPIDVHKFLRCFDLLPDAGAVYSLELLTDIPVDTDPNKLVDWQAGSAGHTFLQFRKQVGSQIVVQNIGFYPVNSWKVSFTNAPVAGKFVDNGNHEYNASLVMPVSAENFKRAVNELRYLAASSTYDLDEFNCTDLAVRVFNAARADKLDIPLYQIPGGITAAGTSTPQGVYNKLKAMQAAGVAEAANISIPGVKGFVANSDGPCN